VKSVPRGKAIWNANGRFVSVLLTHLLLFFFLFVFLPSTILIVTEDLPERNETIILHHEKKLAHLLLDFGVVNSVDNDCEQQVPSVALRL